MVIVPGKNFPGQRGFPTPNTAIETSACRTFRVPADDDWLGLLMGTVEVLTQEWAYYQWGTLTPAEAAAAWQEIFNQTYADSFMSSCDVIPAPFWDEESGDDADDASSIEEQPWYGQIVIIDDRLTFVENAFIYVVAGFIAYAGLPTAAISFVPIARQFVVTMKTNPLGGIVRFLADAVEIGRVDTYSAADGVISAPVVMPAPAMGFVAEDVTLPVLWVELLEDNPHELASVSMTLIRSRLSEADFSNPTIRYNPDTDQIEFTPDGGVTWTPAPSLDIRHSALFLKPPVAGSSKQCDAAANMVKWLKDFIDQMLFDFELVGSVTTIINSILNSLAVVTEGFTSFLALISELAETISGIGGTVLALAFTSDQYDLLLCIFYCNADGDGKISAEKLTDVESDITAQLNTTAALITNAILFIQGEIGLSNAGAIGAETGDCSGCGCAWCQNVNDTSGLGDWTAEDFTGGGNYPTYSGGQWNSVLIGITACLWISKTLMSPVNFIDAGITDEDSSGLNRQIYVNGDGTPFSGTLVWNNGTLVGGALPTDVSRIDVIMVQAFNATPRYVRAMQYSGFGDSPFGESNC